LEENVAAPVYGLENREYGCRDPSALRTSRALLPRNIFSDSGTHFRQRLSKPQGPVRLEELGKLKKKKKIHLIGSRTRDLPACSIVS
jgi:hypothetical protein